MGPPDLDDDGGGAGADCGPGWMTDPSLTGPCCPVNGQGFQGDPTPDAPNPLCGTGGGAVPGASIDCHIALYYRPAGPLDSGNHTYILITGSLGTWIIEGWHSATPSPSNGLSWGNLVGIETRGVNSQGFGGWQDSDNPSRDKEQGNPVDDPGCLISTQLLGFGATQSFNAVSGAPKGGWTYAPLPLFPGAGNCNSYSSFLLDLEDLNFGQPPNTPGWGKFN